MNNTNRLDDGRAVAGLMELVGGFWGSMTIAAAVELNLFTRLANGRKAVLGELADEMDLMPRPTRLLLTACTSLGLLSKANGSYQNTPLSEEYLVAGKRCYFGDVSRYCTGREYLPWHKLVPALRANRPVTWDPDAQDSLFSAQDQEMTDMFWDAMSALSAVTARILPTVYDFGRHHRVLDVGGGLGIFLIELCQRYPDLRGTLFDLPHVCQMARAKVAKAGLERVVEIVPGDFVADSSLPDGHDVILLSAVLHDWDEATNLALLAKCYDALPSKGVLLVCELFVNPEGTGPAAAALMGLNMFVETEGGENYPEDAYLSWLNQVGFTKPRLIRFPAAGANGVLVAHKP
jgi:3-hydroxy-5-methyl-1-naphthoate 3-O-methyltransferase